MYQKNCRVCMGSGKAVAIARAPDIVDRICGTRAVAVGGVTTAIATAACVGVGAGAEVACLIPIFGRAVAAAMSVFDALRSFESAELWVTNLMTYIEATSETLERLRGLLEDGSVTTCAGLVRPLDEIGKLLERLHALVFGYAARGTLARQWELRTFHERREEIIGSLSLWNSNLTQGLQLLQQDTLLSIAEGVKALGRDSAAQRVGALTQ